MNVLEARRRLLGAGVYKKTVTGNPAIAQGSLARMYPGIEMQGWTEQTVTEGNQLITFPYHSAASEYSGINISINDDGSITANGTSTKGNNFYLNTNHKLLPGTYTLSENLQGTSEATLFIYDGASVLARGNSTFSISEEKTVNIYINWGTEGKNINGTYYPMLNYGSEALPYEPYTGGAPSPSPDYPQEIVSAGKYNEDTQKWEYEVKLTGANLFDASKIPTKSQGGATVTNNGDGSFTISGSGNLSSTYNNPYIYEKEEALNIFKTPGIYKISEKYNITSYPYFVFGLYLSSESDTGVKRIHTRDKIFFIEITDNDIKKIENGEYELRTVFYGASDSQINPSTVKIMIYQDGDGTWEPYHSQTVTLTADRPLTKWDRLVEKDGIIGWEYGSAEIVFDGSDDERWNEYASRNGFNIVISGMLRGVALDGFCDKLIISKVDVMDYPTAVLGLNNNDVYIKQVSSYASDVNAWKTWLQSNPITVLYQLAEPVFVPLSEVEQTQMNALHTNRPTTVLSNNQDCEMTLTYKTKKSLEVTA